MLEPVCGHPALDSRTLACEHVLSGAVEDYVLAFTGAGVDQDVLCQPCADGGSSSRGSLCTSCVAELVGWSTVVGIRGTPQVRVADRELAGRWSTLSVSVAPLNDECLAGGGGRWLVLAADGLTVIEPDGTAGKPIPVTLDEPPAHPDFVASLRPALHASNDLRFAAVVHDKGRIAAVLDLTIGATTMRIDRGDHHHQWTGFPLVFNTALETTVIAATRGNRLDIFDPATGALLSERPSPVRDGVASEHYDDYFHGRLHLSPSGRWLVVDGWAWHPVGLPTLIDLEAWVGGETYAAEHGRALLWRAYAWDQPIAWVDDRTIAIQRYGYDDDFMVDGVHLVDVVTGDASAGFAGPAGPMWAHDGRLYVTTAEGCEAWDARTGVRVGLLAGFRPQAQDASGTLAELHEGILRCWTPDPIGATA